MAVSHRSVRTALKKAGIPLADLRGSGTAIRGHRTYGFGVQTEKLYDGAIIVRKSGIRQGDKPVWPTVVNLLSEQFGAQESFGDLYIPAEES